MLSKKGYFFTLDAILGFSILIIGVVMFIHISIETPESKSFDFVNSVRAFYSGKVEQVDFSSTSRFANQLKACYYDNLCQLENQIDQQILILCEEEDNYCDSIARNSLNELVNSSALHKSNLSLSITCQSDGLIYNTTEFSLTEEGKDSTAIATSKWVVVASQGTELYGPCVFEVISWS